MSKMITDIWLIDASGHKIVSMKIRNIKKDIEDPTFVVDSWLSKRRWWQEISIRDYSTIGTEKATHVALRDEVLMVVSKTRWNSQCEEDVSVKLPEEIDAIAAWEVYQSSWKKSTSDDNRKRRCRFTMKGRKSIWRRIATTFRFHSELGCGTQDSDAR